MRILLVTPPMVQVNAPYPATAYLAGALKESLHDVIQSDASLALALRLFSRNGLKAIRNGVKNRKRPTSLTNFLRHYRDYADTVDSVIPFLQGHNPTLAIRIVSRSYLPEGSRFAAFQADAGPHRDALSTHDTAVHLASLYLDDLTDVIRHGVDSRFELARYGEKLAANAPTFNDIARSLHHKPTLVDRLIEDIALELIREHSPDVIGFTLPFPGNVYGALRMAKAIKRVNPDISIIMGGGYVNTELRELSDPRIFDYTDYITLDQGEGPLLSILEHLENPTKPQSLSRTFIRRNNRVQFIHSTSPHSSISTSQSTIPLFAPLPLSQYFSLIEDPNPMHRIWSCGRWNKVMLAHGCYWHRCAFCDTQLDYIRRYSPTPIPALITQIQDIIGQTGQTGFHFIDEAMPPALLRALSTELISQKIQITWWGNIRFDSAFTPDLAALMAESGCVAVTGGLEAATDRLLALLKKGFTLKQAAQVTRSFSEAGILVHAYLMFGCPSQTAQDTVDSLDFVRQLFETGCLQSAYWHRFALTVHSPIFLNPTRYGIRARATTKATFARNEVPFSDSVNCDHDAMGRGLRKALYNYMHYTGLDFAIQDWFECPVPPPSLPTDYVASILGRPH